MKTSDSRINLSAPKIDIERVYSAIYRRKNISKEYQSGCLSRLCALVDSFRRDVRGTRCVGCRPTQSAFGSNWPPSLSQGKRILHHSPAAVCKREGGMVANATDSVSSLVFLVGLFRCFYSRTRGALSRSGALYRERFVNAPSSAERTTVRITGGAFDEIRKSRKPSL